LWVAYRQLIVTLRQQTLQLQQQLHNEPQTPIPAGSEKAVPQAVAEKVQEEHANQGITSEKIEPVQAMEE